MVMSLQYQAFPLHERGVASGIMGIPLAIAPMLGPIVGGYLISTFSWQVAFFINVPLGIIAVAFAQRVLKASAAKRQTQFDLAGFLSAALGSASFVYGIATNNLLALGAGVALLLSFVWIELRKVRRGQQPLLNLSCFRDRTFTCSVLALAFFSIVFFGLIFLIPVYLQTLHQETPFQAGLLQTSQALATLIVIPLAGRGSDRVGPRSIVIVGLAIMSGTTTLMLLLALNSPLWLVVGILVLLGTSNGLAQQMPVAAMSKIKQEDQQAVAHGATLVTIIRAVSAPTGVALLANLVQTQSQQNIPRLAAQG